MTAAGDSLLLGTAKIEITPQWPVPLAGYAFRAGVFEGVDAPLYARVWFFEQRLGPSAPRKAVLIQADLIWWGNDRIPGIVDRLKREWDLDEASVILHATHTHYGPQTSRLFAPSLGEADEQYVLWLERRIVEAVSAACADRVPVTVEKGTGECRIGINRRKPEGGRAVSGPNPDGPIDPEVTVIRFRTPHNACKGVLFHYTCHPTTTALNRVMPDFPGAASELVERETGGGAIAAFLQGCTGDVRPNLVRDGGFYRGDREDVRTLGEALGQEVLRMLRAPMQPLKPAPFVFGRVQARLPLAQVPSTTELRQSAFREGVIGEWARLLLDDPARVRPYMPLALGIVRIADGLSFLTMNAEVVVEYGQWIKAVSGGKVLPLAYSNGMIGYVPTAKQLAEGGYEADESTRYFGMPSPFAPELEAMLKETLRELIATGA